MRAFWKAAAAVALAVTLAFLGAACKGKEEKAKLSDIVDFVLEVPAGRDVKILQLTDIQIIDSTQQRYDGRLHEWSAEAWKPENLPDLAWKYTRQIVERVQPDLIVLSGDNVYGEFDDNGTMLQALVAEMDSYKIPWTLTFGNHDNETHKGVEWTCEQYSQSEYGMFTRGSADIEGNGNFKIGITQDGKLTEIVWLMDSNGHTDSDKAQNMYSTVGLFDRQIAWFESENEKLRAWNGGENVKAIGFFHHPLRAYGDGLQKYGYVSSLHGFFTEDGDYGVFSEVIVPENDAGDGGAMHKDAGEYIDRNYKFHELLKKYGVEGWFFGHDHVNNASVSFEGVRYTYGLKASKYDSYYEGEIGGTSILVGQDGLRVNHVYYDENHGGGAQ